MRLRRIKVPAATDVAVYHCLSRVVDRQKIMGAPEKEQFRLFLREYEQFCGVRVLTYCLMSNHFHLLVEIPKRPDPLPDPEEILKRLNGLTGAALDAGKARQVFAQFAAAADPQGALEYCRQFHRRMWDVSEFMKLLKQRFTQWFNRRMKRTGTLWEDRFKSVLVEGGGDALMTMAAYIDLNPVRAGIVIDPGAYLWSGYGEASRGKPIARDGLRQLCAHALRVPKVDPEDALHRYRSRIFFEGIEGKNGTDAQGRPLTPGIPREASLKVLNQKGELPISEFIHCRVRYFSDGRILGSRAFVEQAFINFRDRFSTGRKSGARRMKSVSEPLFTVRDLKVNVFDRSAATSSHLRAPSRDAPSNVAG